MLYHRFGNKYYQNLNPEEEVPGECFRVLYGCNRVLPTGRSSSLGRVRAGMPMITTDCSHMSHSEDIARLSRLPSTTGMALMDHSHSWSSAHARQGYAKPLSSLEICEFLLFTEIHSSIVHAMCRFGLRTLLAPVVDMCRTTLRSTRSMHGNLRLSLVRDVNVVHVICSVYGADAHLYILLSSTLKHVVHYQLCDGQARSQARTLDSQQGNHWSGSLLLR
jgi:hypothetical protein